MLPTTRIEQQVALNHLLQIRCNKIGIHQQQRKEGHILCFSTKNTAPKPQPTRETTTRLTPATYWEFGSTKSRERQYKPISP